jgi:hypothetical protein
MATARSSNADELHDLINRGAVALQTCRPGRRVILRKEPNLKRRWAELVDSCVFRSWLYESRCVPLALKVTDWKIGDRDAYLCF